MSKRSYVVLVMTLILAVALPTFAGPAPSKTAANQSIESRDADLSVIRDIAANEQVAKVLAANGFSQEEVELRLAQLSAQDLHQLSQNLQQLQAAGLTKQEWIWIGVGALAVLLLLALI